MVIQNCSAILHTQHMQIRAIYFSLSFHITFTTANIQLFYGAKDEIDNLFRIQSPNKNGILYRPLFVCAVTFNNFVVLEKHRSPFPADTTQKKRWRPEQIETVCARWVCSRVTRIFNLHWPNGPSFCNHLDNTLRYWRSRNHHT